MSSSACHDGPRNEDVEMATPGSAPVNVAGAANPSVTGPNTPTSTSTSQAAAAVAGASADAEDASVGSVVSSETPVGVAAPEVASCSELVAPAKMEEKKGEKIEKPEAPASVVQVIAEPAAVCEPVKKKKKINPNKCGMCKKKIGLLGFKCECQVFFCSAHRMAEAHNCTYDFKAVQRELLAQKNTPVHASKLVKI